jgi:hypothetical protein
MNNPKLLHEVWEDFGEQGESLHSLQFAGPRGEDARRWLGPKARLIATIEAGSHYEAMTLYHQMLGREPYTTNQPSDHEPYPEEWIRDQRDAGLIPRDG